MGREAYPNAEKVLQHLADVDSPLKAVLDGPAELERLEVHGPKVEVDKLRDALSPLGCLFYVTQWGFRPAKPAMENDTVCHLYPYFKLKQPEEFKKIWYDAFPETKANMEAEKSHQYAFSFESTADVASCREWPCRLAAFGGSRTRFGDRKIETSLGASRLPILHHRMGLPQCCSVKALGLNNRFHFL